MAKSKPSLYILMLTEYFYPHARGGSEQSSYFLAQALIHRGHQVSILTPNYGSSPYQFWRRIKIFRFPIGKKLNPQDAGVTPFWHTNLFWFIQSTLQLFKLVNRQKPNIIHIQGKYFLPAAVIIAKIKHIPTVFTARDYQIICPLGFCLWHQSRRCSLRQYLSQDIAAYRKFYQFSFLPFHLRARVISSILRLFARQADQVVCISQAQARIFKVNGFKNLSVIYNTTDFSHPSAIRCQPQIIFVGRLTPGKGADLLIPAFAKVPAGYKLVIVGNGFLIRKLHQQIRHYSLTDKVTLTGQIDYPQVLKLYAQSKLAVFPSVWPEPFGRGALEAIGTGTPIVTSNRGGLPEVIQDKYGLSVEPTPEKLAQAIKKVLKNHSKYVKNIRQDRQKLNIQFNLQPVTQYEKLYHRCLS